jgi:hypothetical protein
MRNTTKSLTMGLGIGAYGNGNQVLQQLFDYELSPLQVRALTARLRRQARAA